MFFRFVLLSCVLAVNCLSLKGHNEPCEEGWTHSGNFCYWFSDGSSGNSSAMSFWDAMLHCLNKESLLIYTDAQEFKSFFSNFPAQFHKERKGKSLEYWTEGSLNSKLRAICIVKLLEFKRDEVESEYERPGSCIEEHFYICKKYTPVSSDSLNNTHNCVGCRKHKQSLSFGSGRGPPPDFQSPFNAGWNRPMHPMMRPSTKSPVVHHMKPLSTPYPFSSLSVYMYMYAGDLTTNASDPPQEQSLKTTTVSGIFESGQHEGTAQCKQGELQYRDSCYVAHKKKLNMFEADRVCEQEMKGRIVAFETNKEYKILKSKLENFDKIWYNIDPAMKFKFDTRKQINYNSSTFSFLCDFVTFNSDLILENLGQENCEEENLFLCEYKLGESKKDIGEADVATCPQGWKQEFNECYKEFTEKTTLDLAVQSCQNYGASLISYDDIMTRSAMRRILEVSAIKDPNLWLSPASDQTMKKLGEALAIPPCIRIDRTIDQNASLSALKLRVNKCNPKTEKYSFICLAKRERNGNFESPTLKSNRLILTALPLMVGDSTDGGECDTDWIKFKDNCYLFYSFSKTSPRNWEKSKAECNAKNSHLASIHSLEENVWLRNRIHSYEDNFLWVGGKLSGSKFKWEDGTPFDYSNWSEGEPNNYKYREECIAVYSRHTLGGWNDDLCSTKAGYICKKPATKPAKSSSTSLPLLTTERVATLSSLPTTLTSSSSTSTIMITTTTRATTAAASTKTKTYPIDDEMTSNSTSTPDTTTTTTTTKGFTQVVTTSPQVLESNLTDFVTDSLPTTDAPNDSTSNYSTPVTLSSCLGGWHKMDDKCVKFFQAPKQVTFEQAAQMCKEENESGHLVSIHNERQMSFVASLSSTNANFWIGLRCVSELKGILQRFPVYVIGEYGWMDGSDLDFLIPFGNTSQKKEIKKPYLCAYNILHETCIQIQMASEDKKGAWIKRRCDMPASAFVCQKPLDRNGGNGQVSHYKMCPPPFENFFLYERSCYMFNFDPKPWEDAEEHCKTQHTNLVSIDNFFELGFLGRLLHEFTEDSYWIGLTRPNNQTLRWSNNWPYIYSSWDAKEPDLSLPNSCVSMSFTNWKWKTEKCSVGRPFICEHSLDVPYYTEFNETAFGGCPNQDWIDLGDPLCYNVDNFSILTWPQSKERCKKLGGTLVSESESRKKNILKFLNVGRSSLWTDEQRETIQSFDSKGKLRTVESDVCVSITYPGGGLNNSPCFEEKAHLCIFKKLPNQISEVYVVAKKLSSGAIFGILLLVLCVIGASFFGLYAYLRRKGKIFSSSTVPGFDNVTYDTDTVVVAGEQIHCTNEERECIWESSDEDGEGEKDDKPNLTELKTKIKMQNA